MPNEARAVTTTAHDFATLPLAEAIEAYTPNFAAVLPANVSVDHFKRLLITAVNTNPELLSADRRSLFNSSVKCASDGLLPDGREAALTVMRTKIKNRQGGESYVDMVVYMPMIAGIRKRLRNSGEVDSAVAEVVCRNDKFRYALGDDPFIEHEPPALDQDRGEEIGAYAIIKLTNGEILRDVMRKHEIDRSRQQSRAPNSLMWTKFYGEGAKKTVLRRCAKAAPQASMLEKLLMRDEETDDLPAAEELPAIPARPRRERFALPPQEYAEAPVIEPAALTYAVVDLDGVETEWATPEEAEAALSTVFHEAAKRGADALRGALESNDFREVMPIENERRLIETYEILLKRLQPVRPAPDPRTAEQEDAFGLKPLPDEQHSPAAQPTGKDDVTNGLGGPAAAGEPSRDLLGGQPAENLTVPWYPQDDAGLFVRQFDAMLAEAPLTAKRAATIRLRNAKQLARLEREAPDDYARIWAALAEAR